MVGRLCDQPIPDDARTRMHWGGPQKSARTSTGPACLLTVYGVIHELTPPLLFECC